MDFYYKLFVGNSIDLVVLILTSNFANFYANGVIFHHNVFLCLKNNINFHTFYE